MPSRKIKEIFGENVSDHTIKISKQSQRNKCTFSSIVRPSYSRHSLSDAVKDKVIAFYEDDEISRLMPGLQDFVTVREGDDRTQIQKRLMLSTLKEAHLEFKKRYPLEKIGYDHFLMLRPKHCIKLGVGNQQNVCVCTLHQNMKLMFDQSKLKFIMNNNQATFSGYKDLITFIMCDDSKENGKCSISMCETCCKNLENLQNMILQGLQNAGIMQVKYKKWNTTDRCNLDSFIEDPEQFTNNFIQQLRLLLPHNFISHQQSQFLKNKKDSLKSNEVLVQLDFAENYSFIIQDAVQGYHWTNRQATIHPFVIYYKDDGDSLKHISYIVISDCNNHDSVAVHLFINKLIYFLRGNMDMEIKKITFVSDGAGSQYKNKYNFINLCHFESDFEMKSEWHFHATSHGKSACDGIGGTVKRGAHRYSIANKSTIQTPEDLFEWATTIFKTSMHFAYSSTEEYTVMKQKLQSRYANAITILNTQSFHSFIPVDETSLQVRKYSNSKEFQIRKVSR